MRITVTAAFLLLGICVCAQETKEYSASEARKHVGETATVTDKVANVFESKAGNIFLNFRVRELIGTNAVNT